MEPYILAIDLGTSGPKVGLATQHGELLACEFEPIPLHLLPGGGAEQDPHDWWQAICIAASRVLSHGFVKPEQVQVVSCTGQWSGTVAVGHDGQPLMNAITWMDSRGAPYIKQIISGRVNLVGYDPVRLLDWLRLTGGVPGHAGKDSIAHILYIKNALPEIYRDTLKFLEPKDYLNYRLTGRMAASYDSITLHWLTDNRRIERVEYHPRLLQMSGIDRAHLPDLRRAVDLLGTLTPQAAADLGLGPHVQVITGAPDIQSTAIGSGAVRQYAAHLYLGTSAWLACHVPFKKTDLLHNMAALPSAIPGQYLVTNEQECAGMCLNYLSDNIFFPEDGPESDCRPSNIYEAFNRLAENASPGAGKLIFTPWLYGERTPVDDHRVRGAFLNQTLKTTRADMVRAVFEGVAYNSRWLFGYVEKFIKRRLDRLHMVGGGAGSDLWCQIHSDVLNRPVCQMKDPSWVSVRGAAHLAAVAMGYAGFEELAAGVKVRRIYQPNQHNQSIYNELFREFVEIYKRNKGIYLRLNA